MMAPDYTHWHGMYEVADRWYVHFIPEARELLAKASEDPAKKEQAAKVTALIDSILARPEHRWSGAASAPPPPAPEPKK